MIFSCNLPTTLGLWLQRNAAKVEPLYLANVVFAQDHLAIRDLTAETVSLFVGVDGVVLDSSSHLFLHCLRRLTARLASAGLSLLLLLLVDTSGRCFFHNWCWNCRLLILKINFIKYLNLKFVKLLTVDGSTLIGVSTRSTSRFVSVRVRLILFADLSWPLPFPLLFSDALLLVLELMLDPGAEVFFRGSDEKTCCTISRFRAVEDEDGTGLWMRSVLLLTLFWKSRSTARNLVSIMSDSIWP